MGREFVLLPDDAVSDLQALSESNLPHVVVRATRMPASGARVGGALVDKTPLTLFENEPCRLTPLARPTTLGDASQPHPTQAWTLTLRRGIDMPVGAIVLVRGQDRESDTMWERSLRVIDTQRARLVTSVSRFAVIDAGPTERRAP